jgi:hypothetical protein
MSDKGIVFVSEWIDCHVTPTDKYGVNGDAASLSVEMAETLIAMLPRQDLAPRI